MPEKIELRPAFEWTCEECGRDQYESAVRPEMSDDDRAEVLREMGADEWLAESENHAGELLAAPERVTCKHCQTTFETQDGEYE